MGQEFRHTVTGSSDKDDKIKVWAGLPSFLKLRGYPSSYSIPCGCRNEFPVFLMVIRLGLLSAPRRHHGYLAGDPLTMWCSFSSKPIAKKTHCSPLKESLT